MKPHEWGTSLRKVGMHGTSTNPHLRIEMWATRRPSFRADPRLSLFNEYGHRRSASPRIVDKRQPSGSLDKDGRNVSGGVRNMEPAWLAATAHLQHALSTSEDGAAAVVDDCGRRTSGLRLTYFFDERAQAPLD